MHVKNAGAGKRGYLTGNMQTWQGSGCAVDFLVTFFFWSMRSFIGKSCELHAASEPLSVLTNHSTDSWTNSAKSIERCALELKSYPVQNTRVYAYILLWRIVSEPLSRPLWYCFGPAIMLPNTSMLKDAKDSNTKEPTLETPLGPLKATE